MAGRAAFITDTNHPVEEERVRMVRDILLDVYLPKTPYMLRAEKLFLKARVQGTLLVMSGLVMTSLPFIMPAPIFAVLVILFLAFTCIMAGLALLWKSFEHLKYAPPKKVHHNETYLLLAWVGTILWTVFLASGIFKLSCLSSPCAVTNMFSAYLQLAQFIQVHGIVFGGWILGAGYGND